MNDKITGEPKVGSPLAGSAKCAACGHEETVGIFRNDKRDLEISLCDICETTSAINGFFKMSNI